MSESQHKPTVVIGASPNPERYSHIAVHRLHQEGHPVFAVGLRPGTIAGVRIHTDRPVPELVDTVTLYVGPAHQEAWLDYILSLHPKRVILNPGTENTPVEMHLQAAGIQTERACTLVLLSTSSY
jgi:predicted CoA-binding protein